MYKILCRALRTITATPRSPSAYRTARVLQGRGKCGRYLAIGRYAYCAIVVHWASSFEGGGLHGSDSMRITSHLRGPEATLFISRNTCDDSIAKLFRACCKVRCHNPGPFLGME